MKKLFDEDLSLSDLKTVVKRMRRHENTGVIICSVLGVIFILAIIAAVVYKLHGGCCCCDYDCDCDDDDCCCDDDCDCDDDDICDKDFDD